MKRIVFALAIVIWMSSSALPDSFQLTPFGTANSTGVIWWVSPGNGTVVISGNETASYQIQTILVNWASASYVQTNGFNLASAGGQQALYGGSTQCMGNYGQWPGCASVPTPPAAFGSPVIPVNSYISSPTEALQWNVSKGDVIDAVVQEMNVFSGDTAIMNLNVAFSGDFTGTGALPGQYTGFAGTLDPSAGNTVNNYTFYWNGGDLNGTALTEMVLNGTGPGGFQSGLEVSLLDSAGNVVGIRRYSMLPRSPLPSTSEP